MQKGRLTPCNKRRFFAAINLEKIEEDGARVQQRNFVLLRDYGLSDPV